MDKKKLALITGAIIALLVLVILVVFANKEVDSAEEAVVQINDPALEVVDEEEIGGSWDKDSEEGISSDGSSIGSAKDDQDDSVQNSVVSSKSNGRDSEGLNSSNAGSSTNNDNNSNGGHSSNNNGNNGSNSGGEDGSSDGGMTYAEYMAMSPEQQEAFFESFDSFGDFKAWYDAAKAAHDASNDSIEINGGNVDLGEIVNGNK